MKGRDFEYLWKNESMMKTAEPVDVVAGLMRKWDRRFAMECKGAGICD